MKNCWNESSLLFHSLWQIFLGRINSGEKIHGFVMILFGFELRTMVLRWQLVSPGFATRTVGTGGRAQCYQMELKWRFRDLIKFFKNEKNGFNMQFAFIFNEFSQEMNKLLNRVFKFGLNTWLYYLRFCRKWPIY